MVRPQQNLSTSPNGCCTNENTHTECCRIFLQTIATSWRRFVSSAPSKKKPHENVSQRDRKQHPEKEPLTVKTTQSKAHETHAWHLSKFLPVVVPDRSVPAFTSVRVRSAHDRHHDAIVPLSSNTSPAIMKSLSRLILKTDAHPLFSIGRTPLCTAERHEHERAKLHISSSSTVAAQGPSTSPFPIPARSVVTYQYLFMRPRLVLLQR